MERQKNLEFWRGAGIQRERGREKPGPYLEAGTGEQDEQVCVKFSGE